MAAAMRRSRLAALLLSLVAFCSPLTPPDQAESVSSSEAETCQLERQLGSKRRELEELIGLARDRGLVLSVPEVDALVRPTARPRQLAEAGEVELEASEDKHEGVSPEGAALAAALEKIAQPAALEGSQRQGGEHGGAEHGEEHMEGEEEHHEFESWDTDTAFMLLMMVCFVMVMFYLTNYPDDDIRYYSWKITSITMSIFCSVLVFSGFNELIKSQFETEHNGLFMCVIHFMHCFVYLALMHICAAFESGVMCDREGAASTLPEEKWVYSDALQFNNGELVEDEKLSHIRAVQMNNVSSKRSTLEIRERGMTKTMEVPVQKKRHTYMRRLRRTKAMAMLFAHMAGFAAINSGLSLQRVFFGFSIIDSTEQSSNLMPKIVVWIPLIINQLVVQAAFKLSELARERQVAALLANIGTENSGTSTKAEQGLKMVEEMMQEEVWDGENDVSSLSMSYLAVNVMRLSLTGQLPDEEAREPDWWVPGLYRHVLALYAIGLLAVVVAFIQVVAMVKSRWPRKDEHPAAFRVLHTILNATGMCFSWCLLWATKWALLWKSKMHKMKRRVGLALCLTGFAACTVFLVDKLDDSLKAKVRARKDRREDGKDLEGVGESEERLVQKTDDHGSEDVATEAIRVVINALGILVGFAWEHCFDGSVASVSERTPESSRALLQLLMGCLVCLLVLPAWRRHILQKVMLMEDMMELLDEEDQLDDAAASSSFFLFESLALPHCACARDRSAGGPK